jgi:protein SCO1
MTDSAVPDELALPARAAPASPVIPARPPGTTAAQPAQRSTSRRSWLLALGAAPALGAAAALTESAARGGLPFLGGGLSPRERIQKYGLPNVELVTHTGQVVRFYDDLVKDKKVVIYFLYANCNGICVPVTSRMVKVQRALNGRVGRDIFFYSVSLKPEEDTPEVLRRYAEDNEVGPGWLFLTGKPTEIETLRQGLGFIDLDPVKDADKTNHMGMLRYGIEPEMRWGACPGLSPPEHILRSILWDLDPPQARKDS